MIHIAPATLASASWVTANLRPEDRAEIFCQLPEAFPTAALAEACIMQGEAFTASEDGQPIALFGTTPMTAACFSVWAMGTKRFMRAVPKISRYFMDDIVPRRIEQGFSTAEARVMVDNSKAFGWLKSLGGAPLATFDYGKDGEPFTLFRWTVAGYRGMYAKRERA